MILKRTILKSLSCTAMGIAMTGMAYAQTEVTGAAGTDINLDTPAGQIETETSTNTQVTPLDAPPTRADGSVSGAVDSRGNINSNTNLDANGNRIGTGINTDGTQSGVSAGVNGTDANAQFNTQNSTGRLNADGSTNLNSNQTNSQLGANTNNAAGATLGARAEQLGFQFDNAVRDGLILSQIAPNTPAAALGLRAGDRILGFNGRTYSTPDRFYTDLGQVNASSVPVIYERDGRIFTQNMALGQWNRSQQSSGQPYGGVQNNVIGNSYSANRPSYDSAPQVQSSYQHYNVGAGCGVQHHTGVQHQTGVYHQNMSYPVTNRSYSSSPVYYGQPYGNQFGHRGHRNWDDDDWKDYQKDMRENQKRYRKQMERWYDD